MYSKDKAVEAANRKSSAFVAGINEDVKLKSAKVATSPTGLDFLEITFEKDGQEFKHTEWKPNMAPWMKDPSEVEEAENRQYARMLQILTCFYDDSQLNFVGESFKEFAKWVAQCLSIADSSKLLRTKLVYNKKGYLSLPNTSSNDNKFIERMDVTKEDSKVTITPRDVLVKPVTADVETATDPLNVSDTAAGNTPKDDINELPF
jgi:hypothetical protein